MWKKNCALESNRRKKKFLSKEVSKLIIDASKREKENKTCPSSHIGHVCFIGPRGKSAKHAEPEKSLFERRYQTL